MKYIKSFNTFRTEYKKEDELNEEIVPFLSNLFKNFINKIAAPFKKFRDNFMKGDETPAQKKEKLIRVIEEMSKVAKNNIKNAKEEEELQQILEKFIKQIEEEIKKFEIEIKNIKESKIFEAEESAAAADPGGNKGGNDAPQNKSDDKKTENAPDDKKTENAPDDKNKKIDKLDTGLMGKIALELLKNYFRGNNPLKLKLDAKISAAKDLPAKKTAYIQKLDAIVNQFKQDIQKKGTIEKATAQYKEDNKIKDQTEKDNKIEDKTGKEDENKISDEILKSYGDDIDSLEDLMDKKIRYKRDGYDDNKKPEQQPKLWANGMITSIDDDDEDDITIKILNNKNKKTYEKRPGDILPSQTNKGKNEDKDKSEEDSESQTEVKEILGKTKENPEKMKRFGNILKSLDAKEDNIAQVQKVLGLEGQGKGQKGQGQGPGPGQGKKGQGQDQEPSK
jgi:hypothetical protein